ncbi:MAG: polyprenyl synthetase family protein [Deltaproteobacteria bacterium]|nr:MAG: polyprenyl synthetase family protein [Deltaproteobacteria bacterium]
MENALKLIRDDLQKVNLEFKKNLGSDVPIISELREYLLESGGKRFRPILLLLSAKLCGYREDQHIPLASHIEFIHNATLFHDDVVDKAEIRRGYVSANSKWGNEKSVLFGDFLFTKSFSLLGQNGNWEIFQVLSRARTLMAEGELEELDRTYDLSLTEDGYLSIIARKTASLISAAAEVGAILGEVSEERKNALSNFGLKAGMAFQLADDNLDYISKENHWGKEVGIDLQRGKITLPLIHALKNCASQEKVFVQETVKKDGASLTKESFLRVVEIIERHRGIQYVWERAREYIEQAKRHLLPFEDSEVRQALFALADYVIARRL